MANRTVKDAQTIKGTNPQYLIEKITRTRIYESKYWKEECFALSAELLVDKAMQLRSIGGVFAGNVKPTPFLCLLLKMLQIQPEKDIVIYFITQQDYKYTRALGAMYLRLTGDSMDCYKYLEPLLLDYRKIRRMNNNGEFYLSHMDEYIDELLHEERSCDIILPRIQKRQVMEETNQLETRVSALDNDLEDMDTSDEEEEEGEMRGDMGAPPEQRGNYRDWDRPRRSPSPRYRRSPHRDHRDWEADHERDRDRDRHRGDRDRDNRDRREHRDRDRRRSRSRERHRHRDDKDRDREKRRSHKHRDDDDDRHHHHKSKKSKRDRDMTREEMEIKVANEQRARLGLGPLRP